MPSHLARHSVSKALQIGTSSNECAVYCGRGPPGSGPRRGLRCTGTNGGGTPVPESARSSDWAEDHGQSRCAPRIQHLLTLAGKCGCWSACCWRLLFPWQRAEPLGRGLRYQASRRSHGASVWLFEATVCAIVLLVRAFSLSVRFRKAY